MMDEFVARRTMADVGRLLYDRGLMSAKDGNLSIKLGKNRFLTTPAGTCKGRLGPDDMVVVDSRGEPVARGAKPSTEIKMHMAIYPMRPDVQAVVHTHPPAATAFAVAGLPIDKASLAEVVYNIGVVPLTEYALPSTEKLAAIIGHYIPHYQALLLSNHGVLTVGEDLWDAFDRMDGVEHFAKILIYARQLGGSKELSPPQIAELCDLRSKAGVTSPNPLCDGTQVGTHVGTHTVGTHTVGTHTVGTQNLASLHASLQYPSQRAASLHAAPGSLPPRELVESITREVATQLAKFMGRSA